MKALHERLALLEHYGASSPWLKKIYIVSALASAARRLKRRPRYTPPLLAPRGHELKDVPRCGAISFVATKAATLQEESSEFAAGPERNFCHLVVARVVVVAVL